MAECEVKSCKSKNRELFCAPEDKNKLRKWKQILQINKNEFFVCDLHFSEQFLRAEKFLTNDAFPSIAIGKNNTNREFCQSCLKPFLLNEIHQPITEKIQKIFYEKTLFKINPELFICIECHDKLLDFEQFIETIKAKQELKRLQQMSRPNESQNECPQLQPIPVEHILFENYRESDESSNTIQAELQPQVTTQQNSVAGNEIKSIGTQQHGIKRVIIQTKPQITTSHNTARVPLSSQLVRKIRSKSIHEKQPLNTPEIPVIQAFKNVIANEAALKRRNSVAVTEAQVIVKRRKSNTVPKVPKCVFCLMVFNTDSELKLHVNAEHNKSQLKSVLKPLVHICINCNERFSSYHYLRKHKENCEEQILQFKCPHQYCRFKAASDDDINKHISEVHAAKIKEYKAHELEQQKKDRSRKQKLEVKPDNELRKVQDRGNDSKIKCTQCSELVAVDKFQAHFQKNHIKTEL